MGYRIGLDIGITSVGWALLEMKTNQEGVRKPFKIRDLGVRMFDIAEVSKTGASLALSRRNSRSARRRVRRHRHRILRIKQLLEQQGIMTLQQIENMFTTEKNPPNVYELRISALDRMLTNEELVRVLVHIAQRRGFKSNRKSENNDKELGRLLAAVKRNSDLIKEHSYRTVGEMLFSDDRFITKRNKADDYSHTVSRDMLISEIEAIFQAQKHLGNQIITDDFANYYLTIFASQRNFDDGPGGDSPYGKNLIEKMVGLCIFEGEFGEKRAPKASYTFERFNLLTKVQNIRIYRKTPSGGRIISSLSNEEKQMVIELAYKNQQVTYGQLRKKLNLDNEDFFSGITYGGNKPKEEIEKSVFIALAFYHQIKKQLKNVPSYSEEISPLQMDEIGWIVSIWKSDDNRRKNLQGLGLAQDVIEALLPVTAEKFSHLSIKALQKIIPHLEHGMNYDKACAAAGYDFQGRTHETKSLKLPSLHDDRILNPVVNRGLSQAIKVINAIIREHGSPESVHIELAREMAKSFDERKKISKSRDDNQHENEKIKTQLIELLGVSKISPNDIVKYKLFIQQQERCMYSGEILDRSRLFEPGYAEIDHIIPYSLSFDDSYNNKVLVKTSENRQKGNQTPIEYLRDNPVRLRRFLTITESLIFSIKKKENLLREISIDEMEREDFKNRNLQDTRYISVKLASHIGQYLLFDDTESDQKKRVICVNGSVTAYMRKRWGLHKDRNESDKHHAQDAVVVACIGDDLIHRISTYEKFKRGFFANSKNFLKMFDSENDVFRYIDQENGEIFTWDSYDEKNLLHNENSFPKPWPQFREELIARLYSESMEEIRLLNLPNYPEEIVRPIFVSRMPNRKISGAAHLESIRSPRLQNKGYILSKVDLTKLKLKNGEIEGYYNPQDDKVLYEGLRERLLQFNGISDKAFATPFFKVSKDGKTQTLVKKVKLMEKATMGVTVHKGRGVATNSTMLRIDVFEKDGKNFIVPIYVSDVVKAELPMRAITAHKPYGQWRTIDNSYLFKFSLYPNDLILVKPAGKVDIIYNNGDKKPFTELLFYYKGTNISGGSILVKTHDDSGKIESLGVQSLLRFEKFTVDYLGRISKVRNEIRLGFNGHKESEGVDP
jgi:CRISPR-associated endonuclease Csn1